MPSVTELARTTARGMLIAAAGLVGVIPGLAVFRGGLGAPPQAQSLFAVGLEAVAGMVIMLAVIKKTTLREVATNVLARWIASAGLASIIMLLLYFAALNTAVQRHDYYSRPDTVLVPLNPSMWATPRLDSLVACARLGHMSCEGVPPARDYTTKDVARAATRYGPFVALEEFPNTARVVTVSVLFLLAALFTGLLTVAFIVPAVAKSESLG